MRLAIRSDYSSFRVVMFWGPDSADTRRSGPSLFYKAVVLLHFVVYEAEIVDPSAPKTQHLKGSLPVRLLLRDFPALYVGDDTFRKIGHVAQDSHVKCWIYLYCLGSASQSDTLGSRAIRNRNAAGNGTGCIAHSENASRLKLSLRIARV